VKCGLHLQPLKQELGTILYNRQRRNQITGPEEWTFKSFKLPISWTTAGGNKKNLYAQCKRIECGRKNVGRD